MVHKITHGQLPEYGGRGTGLSPEVVSPYAEFEHPALIEAFYETEGNPDIGVELAVRMFAHAGIAEDPRAQPLIGRTGAQIEVNGKPLTLADYVNYAADNHIDALPGILGFLMTNPGEPDYETMRTTMQDRLEAGRS